jgi:hypothetical protein
MNFDDMFPSNYVKASDLGGKPCNVKIAGLSMERMGDGEMKPVVSFIGAGKPLVLNKTNGQTLKDLYGPNTGEWRGKPIQLYPTFTEFGGKRVECIRMRAPQLQAVQTAVEAAAPLDDVPARVTESFDEIDDEIPF